jgi:hypothetical protein
MGRADIRQAVADFLEAQPIVGVHTIYPSVPKILQGEEFFGGDTPGSGAVIAVHLERRREKRIALGRKRVTYTVALLVAFRSTEADVVAAQADCDALLDLLETRLRSDHDLGGGVVWQAGEGEELFGEDLVMDMALPKLAGNLPLIWNVLRFTAMEMIAA